MTASTMTFVLFFQDGFVAGWASERTRAVADKHPSRVIVFDATKDATSSRVEPPARGEWIEIGAKDCDQHELAAALATLELPEAPVVLTWIAGGLSTDARFATLAKMAGTVIVSSSVITTDGSGLADLTAFIDRFPEIPVQDISYLRLAAWQEVVAEFFDDPELLPELEGVREVEVMAGSDPEMYYLLGWLASRLAWTPVGRGSLTNASGATVAFSMVRDGPPRRLSRVVLKSAKSSYIAEVHPQDDAAICLRVEGAHARDERCAPMHSVDIASLVERAILVTGRDEVFIESLAMAKHIMERQTA